MRRYLFMNFSLRRHVRRSLLGWAFGGFVSLFLLLTAPTDAVPENAKKLQIFFVDVEGGQATLFVTPEGKSLLIDTGWPGNDGRDADRIVSAAKMAGIAMIDYVLVTHFHDDHVGGAPQLAARISVGTFIDHGENRETSSAGVQNVWQAYQKLLATGKYKHISAKPGEVLPLQGVDARVVSSDGALINKPLPGAGGVNSTCATSETPSVDHTENARSLGTLFTFGKLRILDLGDLTSDKERELMCPQNKLGKIDIFVVSHHGWITSNSPVLLNGIAPRVAIMDNSATKGGAPSSWQTVKKAPGLEDLWQLHLIQERNLLVRLHTAFSNDSGPVHNVAEPFIANLSGPDAGNYLKLTAWADGNFEVFNSRTQATKHYAPAH